MNCRWRGAFAQRSPRATRHASPRSLMPQAASKSPARIARDHGSSVMPAAPDEVLPVQRRAERQMSREGGAHVGEGGATADGRTRCRGAEREHGHALAGVIAAAPGWIAAVIAGDDRE